jgi:hypothetical protein
MALNDSLDRWTHAVSELNWGVQAVIFDALTLVASEDIKMVYSSDSWDGTPCLFNAVSAMTEQTKHNPHRAPSSFAPEVVRAFDQVNGELDVLGVNTSSRYVSPLAAEVLLRHFGPLKSAPTDKPIPATVSTSVVVETAPYVEPTDTELAEQWVTAQTVTPPVDASNVDDAELLSVLNKTIANNQ